MRLKCIQLFIVLTATAAVVKGDSFNSEEDGLKPSLSCILWGDAGCRKKCALLCMAFRCVSSNPQCNTVFCDCQEKLPIKYLGIIPGAADSVDLPPDVTFKQLLLVKFMRTPVTRELDQVMPTMPDLELEVKKFLYTTDLSGRELKQEMKQRFPKLRHLFRRLRPRPLAQLDPSVSAEVLKEGINVDQDQPTPPSSYFSSWLNPKPKKFDVNSPENQKRIINLIKKLPYKHDVLETFEVLRDSPEKPLYQNICRYFLKEGMQSPDGNFIVQPTNNPYDIEKKVLNDDVIRQLQNKIDQSNEQKKERKRKRQQNSPENSSEEDVKQPQLVQPANQPQLVQPAGQSPKNGWWSSGTPENENKPPDSNKPSGGWWWGWGKGNNSPNDDKTKPIDKPPPMQPNGQAPNQAPNSGGSWKWPSWSWPTGSRSQGGNQQNPNQSPVQSGPPTTLVPSKPVQTGPPPAFVPSGIPITTSYDGRSLNPGEVIIPTGDPIPKKTPKKRKRKKLRKIERTKDLQGDVIPGMESIDKTLCKPTNKHRKPKQQNYPPGENNMNEGSSNQILLKGTAVPKQKKKKHHKKPSDSDESSNEEISLPGTQLKHKKKKHHHKKPSNSYESSSEEIIALETQPKHRKKKHHKKPSNNEESSSEEMIPLGTQPKHIRKKHHKKPTNNDESSSEEITPSGTEPKKKKRHKKPINHDETLEEQILPNGCPKHKKKSKHSNSDEYDSDENPNIIPQTSEPLKQKTRKKPSKTKSLLTNDDKITNESSSEEISPNGTIAKHKKNKNKNKPSQMPNNNKDTDESSSEEILLDGTITKHQKKKKNKQPMPSNSSENDSDDSTTESGTPALSSLNSNKKPMENAPVSTSSNISVETPDSSDESQKSSKKKPKKSKDTSSNIISDYPASPAISPIPGSKLPSDLGILNPKDLGLSLPMKSLGLTPLGTTIIPEQFAQGSNPGDILNIKGVDAFGNQILGGKEGDTVNPNAADTFGNPILPNSMAVDELGNLIPPSFKDIDAFGNVIPPNLKVDSVGNPIPPNSKAIDAVENPIPGGKEGDMLNSKAVDIGIPIPPNPEVDTFGNPIPPNSKAVDTFGNPIPPNPKVDLFSNPIPPNSKAVDEFGNPIPQGKDEDMSNSKAVDAVENPIPGGKEGDMLNSKAVDTFGNPILPNSKTVDEFGNPISQGKNEDMPNSKAVDTFGHPIPPNSNGVDTLGNPIPPNSKAVDAVENPIPGAKEGDMLNLKPIDTLSNLILPHSEVVDVSENTIPGSKEGDMPNPTALDLFGNPIPGEKLDNVPKSEGLDAFRNPIPESKAENIPNSEAVDPFGNPIPEGSNESLPNLLKNIPNLMPTPLTFSSKPEDMPNIINNTGSSKGKTLQDDDGLPSNLQNTSSPEQTSTSTTPSTNGTATPKPSEPQNVSPELDHADGSLASTSLSTTPGQLDEKQNPNSSSQDKTPPDITPTSPISSLTQIFGKPNPFIIPSNAFASSHENMSPEIESSHEILAPKGLSAPLVGVFRGGSNSPILSKLKDNMPGKASPQPDSISSQLPIMHKSGRDLSDHSSEDIIPTNDPHSPINPNSLLNTSNIPQHNMLPNSPSELPSDSGTSSIPGNEPVSGIPSNANDLVYNGGIPNPSDPKISPTLDNLLNQDQSTPSLQDLQENKLNASKSPNSTTDMPPTSQKSSSDPFMPDPVADISSLPSTVLAKQILGTDLPPSDEKLRELVNELKSGNLPSSVIPNSSTSSNNDPSVHDISSLPIPSSLPTSSNDQSATLTEQLLGKNLPPGSTPSDEKLKELVDKLKSGNLPSLVIPNSLTSSNNDPSVHDTSSLPIPNSLPTSSNDPSAILEKQLLDTDLPPVSTPSDEKLKELVDKLKSENLPPSSIPNSPTSNPNTNPTKDHKDEYLEGLVNQLKSGGEPALYPSSNPTSKLNDVNLQELVDKLKSGDAPLLLSQSPSTHGTDGPPSLHDSHQGPILSPSNLNNKPSNQPNSSSNELSNKKLPLLPSNNPTHTPYGSFSPTEVSNGIPSQIPGDLSPYSPSKASKATHIQKFPSRGSPTSSNSLLGNPSSLSALKTPKIFNSNPAVAQNPNNIEQAAYNSSPNNVPSKDSKSSLPKDSTSIPGSSNLLTPLEVDSSNPTIQLPTTLVSPSSIESSLDQATKTPSPSNIGNTPTATKSIVNDSPMKVSDSSESPLLAEPGKPSSLPTILGDNSTPSSIGSASSSREIPLQNGSPNKNDSPILSPNINSSDVNLLNSIPNPTTPLTDASSTTPQNNPILQSDTPIAQSILSNSNQLPSGLLSSTKNDQASPTSTPPKKIDSIGEPPVAKKPLLDLHKLFTSEELPSDLWSEEYNDSSPTDTSSPTSSFPSMTSPFFGKSTADIKTAPSSENDSLKPLSALKNMPLSSVSPILMPTDGNPFEALLSDSAKPSTKTIQEPSCDDSIAASSTLKNNDIPPLNSSDGQTSLPSQLPSIIDSLSPSQAGKSIDEGQVPSLYPSPETQDLPAELSDTSISPSTLDHVKNSLIQSSQLPVLSALNSSEIPSLPIPLHDDLLPTSVKSLSPTDTLKSTSPLKTPPSISDMLSPNKSSGDIASTSVPSVDHSIDNQPSTLLDSTPTIPPTFTPNDIQNNNGLNPEQTPQNGNSLPLNQSPTKNIVQPPQQPITTNGPLLGQPAIMKPMDGSSLPQNTPQNLIQPMNDTPNVALPSTQTKPEFNKSPDLLSNNSNPIQSDNPISSNSKPQSSFSPPNIPNSITVIPDHPNSLINPSVASPPTLPPNNKLPGADSNTPNPLGKANTPLLISNPSSATLPSPLLPKPNSLKPPFRSPSPIDEMDDSISWVDDEIDISDDSMEFLHNRPKPSFKPSTKLPSNSPGTQSPSKTNVSGSPSAVPPLPLQAPILPPGSFLTPKDSDIANGEHPERLQDSSTPLSSTPSPPPSVNSLPQFASSFPPSMLNSVPKNSPDQIPSNITPDGNSATLQDSNTPLLSSPPNANPLPQLTSSSAPSMPNSLLENSLNQEPPIGSPPLLGSANPSSLKDSSTPPSDFKKPSINPKELFTSEELPDDVISEELLNDHTSPSPSPPPSILPNPPTSPLVNTPPPGAKKPSLDLRKLFTSEELPSDLVSEEHNNSSPAALPSLPSSLPLTPPQKEILAPSPLFDKPFTNFNNIKTPLGPTNAPSSLSNFSKPSIFAGFDDLPATPPSINSFKPLKMPSAPMANFDMPIILPKSAPQLPQSDTPSDDALKRKNTGQNWRQKLFQKKPFQPQS